MIIRARAEDTSGIVSVLELHHPPETGPPLHVHQYEDEGFYILEGTYRFTLFAPEKQVREVRSGDFLMAARGVAHSFRALGPGLGKMLVYFTPGGVEAYFEAGSQIAADDPERAKKWEELGQGFGISVLPRKTV